MGEAFTLCRNDYARQIIKKRLHLPGKPRLFFLIISLACHSLLSKGRNKYTGNITTQVTSGKDTASRKCGESFPITSKIIRRIFKKKF